MTYEEFDSKSGEAITKAFNEVVDLVIAKDPSVASLREKLEETILSAVLPLNTQAVITRLLFEKMDFSDDELEDAIIENYELYKKNLSEQFKSDGLI